MITIEQLQKFCAPDDARLFCTRPYPLDGNTIATDGKILVCVNSDLGAEPVESPVSVAARKYINPSDFIEGFAPLEIVITDSDYVVCAKCGGSKIEIRNKKSSRPCGDCDGEGHFHHRGHSYECKECDGEGREEFALAETETIACEKCNGSGTEFSCVEVDGMEYQTKYIAAILSLPVVQYKSPKEKYEAMLFKFDGGVGRLMPVVK